MTDEIVTKNRVVYGRLTITLPMEAKYQIMHWSHKSHMRKVEFLKAALLIGATQLAKQLNVINETEEPERGKEL